MIGSDFDMAEVMWDAADPCLSDAQRHAALTALHTGEPHQAILIVVTALSHSGYPLPPDVDVAFRAWLRERPGWDPRQGGCAEQLELHVMAAGIRVGNAAGTVYGGYGAATLCYFVLDDAGLADAPHDSQAEALAKWLAENRAGPSLRMDMRINGFGYLLGAGESPSPSDGQGGP